MGPADSRLAGEPSRCTDALVVGAGPVGLTMAAELERHGVSCRIVDRSRARSEHSKALVLWSRSLEMLDDMGGVEAFVAAGIRVRAVSLHGEGQRLLHLKLDGIDSSFDYALMLPQSETERLLEDHLHTVGGRVEREVELVGFAADHDGVSATLAHAGHHEIVRCAWLIGCDGAHSTVRHLLGTSFSGAPEPNDWVLADVRVRGPLPPDEVSIFFHELGILAFFPISRDRFRVIADVGPAASVAHPNDPTLAEVQALVAARGPVGLELHDPVWLSGFRIHERKVEDYRRGRVFLAGDAAHIHSPAGGQGMNTGMQDAYNLAWKLGLVVAGRSSDPSLLLDSYSQERSAVGAMVLRQAGRLTTIATLRNSVAQHLRNRIYSLVGSLGIVQHQLGNAFAELSVNYRGSALCGESAGAPLVARLPGAVSPGDRAPDGSLLDATTGAPLRLFDVLHGTRHVLLLFRGSSAAGDGVGPLGRLAELVPTRYPGVVSLALIETPGERSSPCGRAEAWRVLRDPHGELHRRYAATGQAAYLIRPDGYVGYRSQPASGVGLSAHLDRYLRPAA
jgi:2-polyprenyl-6-methoxyphenol hydroxylase-like FAD-dependent oxidoreductase